MTIDLTKLNVAITAAERFLRVARDAKEKAERETVFASLIAAKKHLGIRGYFDDCAFADGVVLMILEDNQDGSNCFYFWSEAPGKSVRVNLELGGGVEIDVPYDPKLASFKRALKKFKPREHEAAFLKRVNAWVEKRT